MRNFRRQWITKGIAAGMTFAFFSALRTNLNPTLGEIAACGILFYEMNRLIVRDIWDEIIESRRARYVNVIRRPAKASKPREAHSWADEHIA